MAAAAKFQMGVKWKFLVELVLLLVITSLGSSLERSGTRSGTKCVRPDTCAIPPRWTALLVDGSGDGVEEGRRIDPLYDNRGKAVLVALTAASSGNSLHQAHKLESLQSYFHSIDMADVTFVLVNSAENRGSLPELMRLNLTMVLVQEESEDPVWCKLGGKKDDVFIFDRCGRLTYSIPFPLSIIHPRQQLVESAFISTYLDDLCGERSCPDVPQYNGSTSTEDSAETEMLNTTHSILVDVFSVFNVTKEIDLDQNNEEDSQDLIQVHEDRNQVVPEVSTTVASEVSTTVAPNRMWSLVQSIWKKLPWVSKEKEENDRLRNSVPKFTPKLVENENSDSTTTAPELNECNATRRHSCRAWPRKKMERVQTCCNLHSINKPSKHLQKQCKRFTKQHCLHMEISLKCCLNKEQSSQELDNEMKPTDFPSSDPKS